MLISEAYADPIPQTGTASSTAASDSAALPPDVPSPLSGMGILLLIPIMLYFLMIRPNQKRIKEYNEMVKGLKRGDRVVTGGGIIGVIHKIENDEVLVIEIAPEVRVRVMRETISHVVNAAAVNDNKAEEKPRKADKAS